MTALKRYTRRCWAVSVLGPASSNQAITLPVHLFKHILVLGLTCWKCHLKCNEAKPICGPCTRSNHSCTYEDSSALHSGSTSTSTSNSATKQSSTTSSVSNAGARSIATNHGLDYSDPSGRLALSFRNPWSHRNASSCGTSQLVSKGHTSIPCYVNGVENDRIGVTTDHWTPVLEDLDSNCLSPGTPSSHSGCTGCSTPSRPACSRTKPRCYNREMVRATGRRHRISA